MPSTPPLTKSAYCFNPAPDTEAGRNDLSGSNNSSTACSIVSNPLPTLRPGGTGNRVPSPRWLSRATAYSKFQSAPDTEAGRNPSDLGLAGVDGIESGFQSAPDTEAGRNRLVLTAWRDVGCEPVPAKRRSRTRELARIEDKVGCNINVQQSL